MSPVQTIYTGETIDTEDTSTWPQWMQERLVENAIYRGNRRSAQEGRPRALTWHSGRDLVDNWDPAEDVFTVERLLRPGYRGLLAAYEGVGKTYVAIQALLALTSGRPLFNEFRVNEPLAVVYVDQEIGRSEFRRRLTTLAAEMGVPVPDEEISVLTLDDGAISLKDTADVAAIVRGAEALHEATDRKVVVILDSTDSLYGKTLWGDDAKGYDDAIAAIHEGRRDWIITLTAVHTVKKPREAKGSYRMSLQDVLGNITRQADAVILLDEKGDYSLRIDVYKRPGRSSGVLQRDEGTSAWRWTADLDDPHLWPFKAAPRNVVIQAMLGGWRGSAGDLARVLNMTKNTARDILDFLVKDGTADSEPGIGRNAATLYSLRGPDQLTGEVVN